MISESLYEQETLREGGVIIRKDGDIIFAASTMAECNDWIAKERERYRIVAAKNALVEDIERAIYASGSMDNRILAKHVFEGIKDKISIAGSRF